MQNIKVVRTFSMPPEIHDKLRELARISGTNMSAVICALIEREYAAIVAAEKEGEE